MSVQVTHELSGVVVSVSADKAARLGSGWVQEKPKGGSKKSEDKQ